MGPGGVTESIAHFAGYLRVTDDFVRVRTIYDDGPRKVISQPWAPDPAAQLASVRTPDELPTQPYRDPYAPADSSLIDARFHGHHTSPPPMAFDLPVDLPDQTAAPPQAGALQSASAYVAETLWTFSPTPQEGLLSSTQINLLINNNQYFTTHDSAAASLESQQTSHDAAVLNHLYAEMQALTLPGLAPQSSDNATLVNTIAAHDAAEAQSPHTQLPTVAPGVYDNGVPQPAGATFNPIAPTVVDVTTETSHNGMTNPGLDAQTGGNVSVNAASIVDASTYSTGLVVMGDAFSTEAILQTDILYSRSNVNVAGKTDSLQIVTGGNTTDNVASFGQHDAGTAGLVQFSPSANVHVTEINGNFYKVNETIQTNYISNNDVVAQGTTSTFNEVDTGNNNQINYLPLSELGNGFDLIIVQGSYHTSAVISQTNLLLNDNTALMYSARGDTASQSITTGDNTLTNSASIDHYGNTTFQPLTASVSASMTGLENGNFDQTIASMLQGYSNYTINVLYITGDYYDINYISQTNVLLNTDTVVQYLPHVAGSHAPTGAETSSTETINSGGNQLANLASIATLGATSDFQYVGGQSYSDALLVQAELVNEKSVVTTGEGHMLASEVAALTGLHDAPHDHVHGHHHDLFHGLMT